MARAAVRPSGFFFVPAFIFNPACIFDLVLSLISLMLFPYASVVHSCSSS